MPSQPTQFTRELFQRWWYYCYFIDANQQDLQL